MGPCTNPNPNSGQLYITSSAEETFQRANWQATTCDVVLGGTQPANRVGADVLSCGQRQMSGKLSSIQPCPHASQEGRSTQRSGLSGAVRQHQILTGVIHEPGTLLLEDGRLFLQASAEWV